MLDRVFRPAGPGIIFKDFGDEMVVANLDTGLFYSLGGSAPVLWEKLSAGHSGRQIAAAFSGDAASIEAAIGALIAQFQADGLLEPAEGLEAAAAALACGTFEAPSVERFDDLQGLLLVDPIHDVAEAGWPVMPDAPAS
ncbi:PqqD family protein [Xanthobacter tagetidis]|nr:PqqD family protein [Xanthobacter tagetidis]MBB6309811.1 hypothetical protein [Xanthobacter tagetidis]